MESPTPACFVFVDLENVPDIPLGLIDGHPVSVTLLIGKNQKQLDLALVQQIHRQAARVHLIEVGAAGHNALDMTLAYYLGQSAQQHPTAAFCIVSRDKDFDPLVAHMKAHGIKASRHETFAALPFLPAPKKAHAPKAPAPAKVPATADRLEKLIVRLRNSSGPRPKKKASLLAWINTVFGNKLDDTARNEKLAALIDRQVVSIDAQDRVTYPQ